MPASPCTFGTNKTRNVLVPSSPGQVIVVGDDGKLVAGGLPVQWRGEWVSTVDYKVSNIVKRFGGVYVANVDVAKGGDPPDRFTLDGIPVGDLDWLVDGVFVERQIVSHSPRFYANNDGLLVNKTFCSSYILGFYVSAPGDVTIEWQAPSPSVDGIVDWFGFVCPEGVELGDQSGASGTFNTAGDFPTSDAFNGDNVGGTFTYTAASAGAYFIAVTTRVNFFGFFNLRVSAVTATLGTKPTIKWDQISHEPLTIQLFRGNTWAEEYGRITFLSPSTATINWASCLQAVVYVSGAFNSMSFAPPGSNSQSAPLKLTLVQLDGTGTLDPTLFTSCNVGSGTIHGAGNLPTNLGTNVGDSISVYFEWFDGIYPSVDPQYLPVAVFNDSAGSTGGGSDLTRGTLTASTDQSPTGTLTIDWTTVGHYAVTLDTNIDTFIFVPPANSRAPLILELIQAGGNLDNTTDVWYSSQQTGIVNWRDIPTLIYTGGKLIVEFAGAPGSNIVGDSLSFEMLSYAWDSEAQAGDSIIDGWTTFTTGGSYTMIDGSVQLAIDNASPLATFTVTFPPNPPDHWEVALSSTSGVTALTLSANSGQTVKNAITTLAAGVAKRYRFQYTNKTWFPSG